MMFAFQIDVRLDTLEFQYAFYHLTHRTRSCQFAHQPPIRIRDSAAGVIPGADDGVCGAVYGGAIYVFRKHAASQSEVVRALFHALFRYEW